MTTQHRHAFARLRAKLSRVRTRARTKPAVAAGDRDVQGIPPCSLHFEETGIRIRYVPRKRPPRDE